MSDTRTIRDEGQIRKATPRLKPPYAVLGYRSKTTAILALLKAGKSIAEVADILDTSVKIVTALAWAAKNRGNRSPRRIEIGQKLERRLKPYAQEREMEVAAFVRYLLDVATKGNLIDAVLDDKRRAPTTNYDLSATEDF